MFPQMSEALLHERVREFHQAAETSRRVKLARQARQARRSHAATATAAHPVAALRSLTTASRAHEPAQHAGGQTSRRAA
jgi:hypothetical protein